jgi:hypothetical protein
VGEPIALIDSARRGLWSFRHDYSLLFFALILSRSDDADTLGHDLPEVSEDLCRYVEFIMLARNHLYILFKSA